MRAAYGIIKKRKKGWVGFPKTHQRAMKGVYTMFTVERKFAQRFNGFVAEMLQQQEEDFKRLSYLDKAISDLLHFLENNEAMDDETIKKVGTKLHDLRVERRNVKNELTDLDLVLKRTGQKVMKEKIECEYAPRTDVLKDF